MRRDDACVLDMLIAARKIRAFTDGVTLDRFRRDEIMQHGIVPLSDILGEAARHVSDDFRATHPEIPWRQFIGMRNRMVHEYFREGAHRRTGCGKPGHREHIRQDGRTVYPRMPGLPHAHRVLCGPDLDGDGCPKQLSCASQWRVRQAGLCETASHRRCRFQLSPLHR